MEMVFKQGEKMTEEHVTEHKCSVCQYKFTDDEGGVHGEFGIIPVSFCPTCFSCMCDMVEQLDDDSLRIQMLDYIEEFTGSELTRHPMFSEGYDLALLHMKQLIEGGTPC